MTNPPAYPEYPGNEPEDITNPYAAFPPDTHEADQPGYYMAPEDAPTHTDGKLRPLEAIAFGIKRPADNYLPWFGYVLIMLAVSVLLNVVASMPGTAATDPAAAATSPVSMGFSVINGLVSLVLSIAGIVAGIRCVDRRKVPFSQFFSGISWLPMIGMIILQGLISLVVIAIVIVVSPGARDFAAAVADNADALSTGATADPADPAAAQEMTDLMMSLPWGSLAITVILVLIVSLVLSPLISYWAYFLGDTAHGSGSFGKAIADGFRAGARNIGQIIILNIIVGVFVTVGILITFGLGMFYLLPVAYLVQAHAYRQIAGGPVPLSSLPPQI